MSMSAQCAVLLSYYNGGAFFRAQMDSLFSQVDCDFDVLIRNDGSDSSCLNDYLSLNPSLVSRIKVYEGPNLGFAASFLELNRIAYDLGYKYFTFCDQDDVWHERKLSMSLAGLTSSGSNDRPQLMICGADLIDSSGATFGRFQFQEHPDDWGVFFENYYPGHLMFYNRPLARLLSLVNFSRVLCHDWVALILANVYGGVILNPAYAGVQYRQHSSNHLGTPSLWSSLRRKIIGIASFSTKKAFVSTQLAEIAFAIDASGIPGMRNQFYKQLLVSDRLSSRVKHLMSGHVFRKNKVDSFILKIQYILGAW